MHYGVNQKTVRKWRERTHVDDKPIGPATVCSTVLSPEEEAMCVDFRKHTLLALDDCLYALQASIAHLTRSGLHRLFQLMTYPDCRSWIVKRRARKPSRLTRLAIFHIDIGEVRTEEGKLYMFVAIDRTSKYTYVELHERATRRIATDFLKALCRSFPIRSTPYGQIISHKALKSIQHLCPGSCKARDIHIKNFGRVGA